MDFQLKRLTGSTASVFLEYLQRNLPEGVAMKVTKVRKAPCRDECCQIPIFMQYFQIHWVPLTTSKFLCIKIIDRSVKFSYYEHSPTTSSFPRMFARSKRDPVYFFVLINVRLYDRIFFFHAD